MLQLRTSAYHKDLYSFANSLLMCLFIPLIHPINNKCNKKCRNLWNEILLKLYRHRTVLKYIVDVLYKIKVIVLWYLNWWMKILWMIIPLSWIAEIFKKLKLSCKYFISQSNRYFTFTFFFSFQEYEGKKCVFRWPHTRCQELCPTSPGRSIMSSVKAHTTHSFHLNVRCLHWKF